MERNEKMYQKRGDPAGGPLQGWRQRLYTIIFESDTRAGRWFDQGLMKG